MAKKSKEDVTHCQSFIQMLLALMLAPANCTLLSAPIETRSPSAAFPPLLAICMRWPTGCAMRDSLCGDGVYQRLLDSGYQILEARGLEVYLVNAQHVKNVPGRKTDVSDCQWLQYLHSVGLLRASFRPPGFICAMRSLWRHRGSLIQMAAEHVLHMQKALDQMNLQIHRVLNDITGVSGLRILDAILAGERDPLTLARLCHGGVKNSEDAIAKSLEGDYRPEHLFALRQSLAAFHYYQKLVLEADQEIKLQLGELKTAATAAKRRRLERKFLPYQRRRYEPRTFDLGGTLPHLRSGSHQCARHQCDHAQTILCEIGTDVSRFRNASAFASWLGLCPEKKISGGKVLFTKSRRVRSRVATALRMCAQSLHHAKDYLGEFFRRITRKLGRPQAITATAHKLARIIFHLLTTQGGLQRERLSKG